MCRQREWGRNRILSKKDLSPTEFELMEILWQKGEATAREIQEALGRKRKLAHTTIATLLSRMRTKGCIEANEGDGARVYRPTVVRDQVVRRKVDELVKSILGGDIRPLLAYIAEDRGLSQEQLAELEEITKSGKED